MEPAAPPAARADEDPIGAPTSLMESLPSRSSMTRPSVLETRPSVLEREHTAMANSVTVAKGSRFFDGSTCRVKRSGRMNEEAYSFLLNEAVNYAAVHSTTTRAEGHLNKLDCRKGYVPEVETFNALLESIGRKGDLKRAEAWFAKLQEPALHPELGGMAPNKDTYDVMVQAAAQAGDMRRAEKFLEIMRMMYKPSRASYFKCIEAFVRAHEIKRAHHVLEALVRDGCDQCEHYEADAVKEQRLLLKSMRAWDPGQFVDLVVLVIRKLADTHNTDTAQRWLEYLLECGLKAEDRELADTWEYVRGAVPKEIMPARLYSQSDLTPARGEPAMQLPAAVCGEEPPQRPDLPLPPPIVEVKEDLKEQPELSALPWTCAHGAKPGAKQDSQAQMRSTWGGTSTPRTVEGRVLAANHRRAQKKVTAAMVLASPVAGRPGYAQRCLTAG